MPEGRLPTQGLPKRRKENPTVPGSELLSAVPDLRTRRAPVFNIRLSTRQTTVVYHRRINAVPGADENLESLATKVQRATENETPIFKINKIFRRRYPNAWTGCHLIPIATSL
jgi:hypothetical protein